MTPRQLMLRKLPSRGLRALGRKRGVAGRPDRDSLPRDALSAVTI